VNGVGLEPTSRIPAYAANYTSHPFKVNYSHEPFT